MYLHTACNEKERKTEWESTVQQNYRTGIAVCYADNPLPQIKVAIGPKCRLQTY